MVQYDSDMQGQAQAAAAQGMALRYVGSLDLVHRKCTVELKVTCTTRWLTLMHTPHGAHDIPHVAHDTPHGAHDTPEGPHTTLTALELHICILCPAI